MGIKFETGWGVASPIFKITLDETIFSKMTLTMMVLKGIFEAKFQDLFFF